MDDLWPDAPRVHDFALPSANAVVGGKTYRCQSGAFWTSVNGTAPGDAGCRIDALAAAAAATGTAVPAKAPKECKFHRNSEPCLRTEQGDLYCFSSETSTQMPTAVLHADLRCAGETVDATYEVVVDADGGLANDMAGPDGLAMTRFRKKPPGADAPPPPPSVSSAPAVEPPVQPQPPAWSTTPVAVSASDDIPAFPRASAAPPSPPATPPPPSPASSAPSTSSTTTPAAQPRGCEWFGSSRIHRACAADADCPLPDAFGVWYKRAHALVKPGETTSVRRFLEQVRDQHAPDLAWKGAPQGTLTKRKLQIFYERNEAFRAAVDATLHHGTDWAEATHAARQGACVAGACAARVDPTTRLFDGRASVTFLRGADGALVYERDGAVHARLRTQACDASDAPAACRSAPLLASTTLRAGKDAVRDAYRVRLGGVERLVRNRLETGEGDADSAKADCAAQLCARNADACPAPYCSVDAAGGCVPDPGHVAHVELR